ncbi:glutamate receptor 1-like [Lutzomyia longipalpis]|uniref:glutamate receptor 1-like n=1 Tax=Lutzomyia longipalpis TaxID=7200 RepID=UPI002483C67C|nr:glutamate receptor 1-like [Lutzomyia longipalpis]
MNCVPDELLGDFLRDFTKHENIPTTLSILNCKPQSYTVKIAKGTGLQIVGDPEKLLEVLVDRRVKRNDVLNIVDLDCPSARNYLSAIHPSLLEHPMRWIFHHEVFNLDEEQFLENLPLRIDSNVILAKFTNSSTFTMAHVYRINRDFPINHEDYGGWEPRVGITDIRPTRILSRRRSNLQRTLLTASIVITNPDTENHLDDYKDKHVDPTTKVNYKTTNILIDMLNATVKYIRRRSWGAQNKTTGKWTGMMGDMTEGRAEIGGTSLFIRPDRVEYVEFLTLTVSTYGAFVFRPPPLSFVVNIFYLPFQGSVWLAALFSIILCTLTFFFTWKHGEKIKNVGKAKNLRGTDAVMTAVAAITQQGTETEPRMLSGRIASFFMYLSMFFLFSSYAANIVALLQSTTTSISTVQDLLDSNLGLGVEDIVYNHHFFKLVTDPAKKALYETKIKGKKDKFIDSEKGVARVRQGFYAFFCEVLKVYKLIEDTFYEHEKCGIMEIKFLQLTDPWYAIQKYSPYKEIIKENVVRMKEFGVERREASKFTTKKPICVSAGSNFGSVRLIDCYMTVTIIISGSLIKIAKTMDLSIIPSSVKLLEVLKDPTVKRNDVLNIVDLNCPSARNYLAQIHPNLLKHPMRWILLAENFIYDEQRLFLENLPLRLDSNVLLAKIVNSTIPSIKSGMNH